MGFELYELIAEACTGDQIKSLLREYNKDATKEQKEDVRISADTVDDLSKENLRRAVAKGIIPLYRAQDLLREAEENGGQHTFFYIPRTAKIESRCKFANAGAALFGKHASSMASLSAWDVSMDKTIAADFRSMSSEDDSTIKSGIEEWILKSYGHEMIEVFIDEEEEGEDVVLRRWRKKPIRTTNLFHWRGDWLELRVQKASSVKTLDKRKNAMWDLVSPWANPADFVEVDLYAILRKMALKKDEAKNKECYELGNQQFLDSEGYATSITCPTEEPTADSSGQGTKNARQSLLGDSNTDCCNTIVFWLPNEKFGITKPLRTVVGTRRNRNELEISSQVGSRAVRYVTNHLRRFAT